jgi:ubiquinone/menaquinone biosynthesis C-methylase UbiE
MLTLAKELRAANQSELRAEVEFVVGDASDSLFPNESFDAIYSRFGVMFFDNPPAAFATLRKTLKPEGQLGFVCWQSPSLNPFFTAPLQAALSVLPAPPQAKPGAPGPFGLADPDVIKHVLTQAGFKEPRIEPLALELSVGASQSFEEIFEELIQIGPAAALIAESDPSLKDRARKAVYDRLLDFFSGGNGVSFEANFWLVTAQR